MNSPPPLVGIPELQRQIREEKINRQRILREIFGKTADKRQINYYYRQYSQEIQGLASYRSTKSSARQYPMDFIGSDDGIFSKESHFPFEAQREILAKSIPKEVENLKQPLTEKELPPALFQSLAHSLAYFQLISEENFKSDAEVSTICSSPLLQKGRENSDLNSSFSSKFTPNLKPTIEKRRGDVERLKIEVEALRLRLTRAKSSEKNEEMEREELQEELQSKKDEAAKLKAKLQEALAENARLKGLDRPQDLNSSSVI